MEVLYGVSVQKLDSKFSKAYLVQQGANVSTFVENHPTLTGVLHHFRRTPKPRFRLDLIKLYGCPAP